MLGNVTAEQVGRIVGERFGADALGELTDPAARRRARERAEAQGLAAELADETDDQPIPALPFSRFRDYRRNGNRRRYERLCRTRDRRVERAAMACLLGLDRRELLNDLLWADCETTWWIMSAHERHGTGIDLRAAILACRNAVLLTALPDAVDPEVRERMLDEMSRRVFRPYLSPACRQHWKTSTNNWNAVCVGAITLAALLLETEPARLARFVVEALEALPHFLDGFAADGGCTEGPSYWRFGFGWYIRAADALHTFSDGQIDIASDERIGRICRYPLSVAVAPGEELTFADASAGYQDPITAQLINRFHDVPELLGLCRLDDAGRPPLGTLEHLLRYDGWTAEPAVPAGDHHMPALGVALVRAGGTVLGAKAGHNGEHHNHNDVGSFMVYRDGAWVLTDPGGPVYSARTFSSRRYESIFCNSLGHSVPVVNGRQQAPGADRAGTLAIEGLGGEGARTLTVELAGAYDLPELTRLTRTLELSADGGALRITDDVALDAPPETFEETFITTHPAEPARDGRSVTIRPAGAAPATLSARADGAFAVLDMTAESEAESRTGEVVRRIVFTPDRLAPEMHLTFELNLA